MCYEKWRFGTWVTLRQYTTHGFYFDSNRKTILTNFFLSLLPTLFNRRGNNSICCTWLEPGMRKLWMMSLPGIWPLKSSRSSHGRAGLELQWSGRYRRPPVQTRVGLPSQHVKSFLVAWVVFTIMAPGITESKRSLSLTFSPSLCGLPLPFFLLLQPYWPPGCPAPPGCCPATPQPFFQSVMVLKICDT